MEPAQFAIDVGFAGLRRHRRGLYAASAGTRTILDQSGRFGRAIDDVGYVRNKGRRA